MIIDCEECVMQGTTACADCVVTVLLDQTAATPLQLDADEKEAIDHLADAGLVAPLRLVPRLDRNSGAATG